MAKLIRWKPEDDNWLREFYNELSFNEIKSYFFQIAGLRPKNGAKKLVEFGVNHKKINIF